jgi:hypothetical protein
MTGQSAPYRIPDPVPLREGPQVAPGRGGELLTGHCIRCGAVGTHYLTCPSLRLPSWSAVGSRRRCSGPDHPDWPLPPQHCDPPAGFQNLPIDTGSVD